MKKPRWKMSAWLKRALNAADMMSNYVDQATDQVDELNHAEKIELRKVLRKVKVERYLSHNKLEEAAAILILKKLLDMN
jgi:hypothetical protein